MSYESKEWMVLEDALRSALEWHYRAAMKRWDEMSGEPRGIVNEPDVVLPWQPPAGWRKDLELGS